MARSVLRDIRDEDDHAVHLHKQATTTPKARAALQPSDEPASSVAECFGTTEQTVYRWRRRCKQRLPGSGQRPMCGMIC
ncbi:helix-turn-helix domain-containing protein [Oceaniovalibus sp. ACAM 378]|uniref:helix-turn-helix domain-containing protein n=1 Tax=Oceaniovalibus sp. ACAM 378 TaxID=2599923 RepID=UPI00351AE909